MQQQHNVLMITLDSCRYDTAKTAKTPNLDTISKLHIAEAPGSYTFPAHNSYFIGILPRPLDNEGKYFSEYEQVWRAASARETTRSVFEAFNESTIVAHYESLGHKVFGYGGVSFFDTANHRNMLPKLFKNFIYYGNGRGVDGSGLPRSIGSFPMMHIEEIANSTKGEGPFFIFINETSTHIPYDFPYAEVSEEYKLVAERLYKEHYSLHNIFYDEKSLPLSSDDIYLLKSMQVGALEWIDAQIGKLLSLIQTSLPTLVLVMADHGDEFGEHGRFGHAHNSPEVLMVPMWVGLLKSI